MAAPPASRPFGVKDWPSNERFARVCAHLRIDQPDWFEPRRAAVLSALEATTQLTAPQLRTIVRAQHPRLRPHQPSQTVSFDGELRAALGSVREEARLHGRLGALGQAWSASNLLVALVTAREPRVTPIVATAVAGEVLCRLLDDVGRRHVLTAADEDILRRAWRAAHPPPAYFRRPIRA